MVQMKENLESQSQTENSQPDTKGEFIKRKTDKLDFIKIKNFYSVEDPVKGMKRQATDWEKIFGNHISNKVQYLENIKISKLNQSNSDMGKKHEE